MPIMIDRYIQNGFIQKLLDILGGPFIEIEGGNGGNGGNGNGNGNGDGWIVDDIEIDANAIGRLHGENIIANSPFTGNPHLTLETPRSSGEAILTLESVDIDIDFSCMNQKIPQYIDTDFRIMEGISNIRRTTGKYMKIGGSKSIDTSGIDGIGIEVGKSRFSCGEDIVVIRKDIQNITFKLSYMAPASLNYCIR